MAERTSVRGVGRDAAGSSPHTQHIWNYVNEHPGCTLDEVKAAAIEQAWVPTGYATRWYARTSTSCNDVALDRKQAAVITATLNNMLRYGSLQGGPSGYWAKRRPRVPQTAAPAETWTMGRNEIVASIKQTELLRALAGIDPDTIEASPHARLSRKQMLALAAWLRAVRIRRIDTTPGD